MVSLDGSGHDLMRAVRPTWKSIEMTSAEVLVAASGAAGEAGPPPFDTSVAH
jgi:hypothetical protein